MFKPKETRKNEI